jgi:extracellular matrix protein 14
MRRPTAAVLGLLLLCPSLVAAAPPAAIPHHRDPSHAPRPWRRLSDAIITKVWGLPDTQKSLRAELGAASGAPSELVARYGNDLVLRFTLTTPAEAAALAEAAEILFLDVWEFNADWVDIRIAKDVVGHLPRRVPAAC